MGVSCLAFASHEQAVHHVRSLVLSAAQGYTVAINAEKIVRCQNEAEFGALVRNALVKVPDGAGAQLALRWLQGVRSIKVNFPKAVMEAAAELGDQCRFGIIGSTEESLRKAALEMRRRYPAINLVMQKSGFIPEAELLEELRRSRPQLCLVAMGTPKQELFATRAVQSGINCLFVGCGGALDILSGHAIRAPQWMVDHYLEWLYRLLREPSRWRRQTALPVFLVRLLKAKLTGPELQLPG